MSSVAIVPSAPRPSRRFLTEADLPWAFSEVDPAFGPVTAGRLSIERSIHAAFSGGAIEEYLVTRDLTMPTGGGVR